MNTNNNDKTCNDRICNTILETIRRIDRAQKRAVIDESNTCITCERSLLSTAFNTIPLTFTTCCGNRITGIIDLTGTQTAFYRIESIRCNRYVTVRLLEETTVGEVTTLVETPYTMIVDIECIGSIQCFSPISITLCTSSMAMSDNEEI